MHWSIKTILYIVNSFIIFAMATASTTVIADENSIKLSQERPVFYNWVKHNASLSQIEDASLPVSLEVNYIPSNTTGIKAFLQKTGVLVKDQNAIINLSYKNPRDKEKIKSVKFIFPEEYFENYKIFFDEVEIINSKTIDVKSWRSFPIEAKVEFKTGEIITLKKNIEPNE